MFDAALFDDAAQMVYDAGGFDVSQLTDPRARKVIDETTRIINRAVDAAVPHEVPETLRYALENNGFIFSGLKTFHALREVGLSMLDDQGNVKPFDDFRKDVQQINKNYNVNWLNAEYKHALGSSLMAVKWNDLKQDTDRYFLQYRTAQDSRVRPDHAALDGITLPADDPFWSKYYPPNGWGCRCQAVQVRRSKYQPSDPKEAMKLGDEATETLKQQMFRYNAGTEMALFPPKHPYYKAPAKAKKVIKQMSEEEQKKRRIDEMIKELPDTLTADEKKAVAEHNLDIETAFDISKGKAMDYENANKGKENPNFSKGGGYRVNCQTCTVTHWLRRLGFDMEAKPNIKGSAFDEMKKQGINWTERFTNLDGSKPDYDYTYSWKNKKGYKTMTRKRLDEYFAEKCSHDGVYEIYCAWKGGSAHVFCAEVKGGKIRFFDPQSGKDDVHYYLDEMKPNMVGCLRIDDKLINPKLKNLFISK